MTVIALVFAIILSIGSIAWGFAEAGLEIFVRWILIFGAVWLFTIWRNWNWFSSVGLFFAVLVSAIGVWIGLTPGWIFSGSIFALFAWDMTDFRQRMNSIAIDDNALGMERRHIARVSFLSLAGLLLASIAMIVKIKFTFEWGALLVLVILFGLGQLVLWFRK